MSLSDFASIASVIGVFAVVVSLIYLNAQTRQNAQHAMAAIQQGRSNQISELVLAMVADPSLVESVACGTMADATMSDIQVTRYLLWYSAFLYSAEDQWHHHRHGLIEEARFSGLAATLKDVVITPGWRAVWTMMKGRFDPSFQHWVDDLVAAESGKHPVDRVATWKSLAAGELAKIST